MSRSRSAQSHSRSRSLSSMAEGRGVGGGPASHLDREKSLEYCDFDVKKERLSPLRALSPSPPPKKSKREKRKKEKRQRRSKHLSPFSAEYRQPHSGSDMEIGGEEDDEGEANGRKKLRHETSPKVFIGPVQPIVQPPLQQQPHVLVSPVPSPFYQRHLAGAAAATNDAMLMKQQQSQLLNAPLLSHQKTQMIPKVELRNQSIMLDLSDPKNVSPPKFKPIGELVGYHHLNGSNEPSNFRTSSPPPPSQPMLRNLPMPTVTTNESPSVTANFFNPMTIQEPGLPLNNFREIQRAILQDVRYKAQEEEEDHIGHLRLSLLSRKGLTEEKREEKIAKMTPELRERISKRKRQLELSYRNDCEAYGLVVNKLIAKDRSLEERLKVALLETMKDLETETIKQLDEFLDQLSFCA
uniref:RAB6-interacting golgin n=1 Tax=Globodera rostochiensis TaxID=31243 RepID=A0A914I0E3_GLORO